MCRGAFWLRDWMDRFEMIWLDMRIGDECMRRSEVCF